MKFNYQILNEKYCIINSKYYHGINCEEFPNSVDYNWLDSITKENKNIDFSIKYNPVSIPQVIGYLNSEIKKVKNDLYLYTEKNEINPVLNTRLEELEHNLKLVSKGSLTLFYVNIQILIKSNNKEKIMELIQRIHSRLNQTGIISKSNNYNHEINFINTLPLLSKFNKDIIVPENACAATFPFSNKTESIDSSGILFGFTPEGRPILKNIWNQSSYSGAIIGPTGFGKTFTAKFLIEQEHSFRKTRLIILDPQVLLKESEYTNLIKQLNGTIINITPKKNSIPPILHIKNNYYDDIIKIKKILSLMLGGPKGINETQKPWLEKAIIETLNKAGIVKDDKKTYNKFAKLDLLFNTLKELSSNIKSSIEKSNIETLIYRLSRFISGIYSFFNTDKFNINFNEKVLLIAIQNFPEELKPITSAIIINYLTQQSHINENTILLIEEAHLLLKDKTMSDFLSSLIVMVRKTHTGLWLVFQDLGQINNCIEAETLLNNLMFVYLIGTKNNLLKKTSQTFDLNENETSFLSNIKRGGLLIFEKEHYFLNVKVPKKSENNTELLKKTLYYKNKLSSNQIKYLKQFGYKENKLNVYDFNNNEINIICKTNNNESLQHHYYKWKLKEIFPKSKIDFKLENNTIDLFIEDEIALGIQIETNKITEKEIKNRIKQLNKHCNYWIICTKSNMLKEFKYINDINGFVLTPKNTIIQMKKLLNKK